jgi:EpsI family protein
MMLPGRRPINTKTWLLTLALCLAAVAARLAHPSLHERTITVQLESSLPNRLEDWSALASPIEQVSISRTGETDITQPYDQSVLRTYADGQGHQIALAVAWGKHQRQEIKIHRPELCYPAQGFAVQKLIDHTFAIKTTDGLHSIIGKRMLAADRNGALEVVSYWIRIGQTYSDSAFKTRVHILKEGLAGRITDGMLVRVSQRVPASTTQADLDAAFERQENFAAALVAKVNPATRDLLAR